MIPSPFKDAFVNAVDEVLGVDNAWAMTHYQFRGVTVVESVSKLTDEQSRRVGGARPPQVPQHQEPRVQGGVPAEDS